MTTDPKDAEIARLTAELFEMTRSRDEWRNDFRALEKAIVGDTGLSAMTVAAQARLFRPRAEKAEAERDAALAWVAEQKAVLSEILEWSHRQLGLYPDWHDRLRKVLGQFDGDAGMPERYRRDAQMRAEGLDALLMDLHDLASDAYDNGKEPESNTMIRAYDAITALRSAPPVGARVSIPSGLIDALRSQRQIDADGCEVAVSRQACDEAAAILAALLPAGEVE